MKFVENPPNKKQAKYLKLFNKLDDEIISDSIKLFVPDVDYLKELHNKKLAECENNFERKKLARKLELKFKISEQLVQIVFELDNINFDFPIYFELIPLSTSSGSILEGTINTVFKEDFSSIFFGRTLTGTGKSHRYSFIQRELTNKASEDVFKNLINIEGFQKGKFTSAQFVGAFRHEMGSKFLTQDYDFESLLNNNPEKINTDTLKEFKVKRERFMQSKYLKLLKNDSENMEYLKKFYYLEKRKFKPVDMPKNVISFGKLESECVGSIFPISDSHMSIQVGDFRNLNKSPAYNLFKNILIKIKEL